MQNGADFGEPGGAHAFAGHGRELPIPAADADEVAELVRARGEGPGLGERGEREHFGGVGRGERDEIARGRGQRVLGPNHLQHGRAFDELPVRREIGGRGVKEDGGDLAGGEEFGEGCVGRARGSGETGDGADVRGESAGERGNFGEMRLAGGERGPHGVVEYVWLVLRMRVRVHAKRLLLLRAASPSEFCARSCGGCANLDARTHDILLATEAQRQGEIIE